jgi:capsid protein
MPKYVIERQYLVPMYQHIVIEAETFEAACQLAMSDDISWDSQEMDCDNARATTLTAAKMIPEAKFSAKAGAGVLFDRADRPRGYSLASFLYGNETETGPRLEIPATFTNDE